MRSPAFYRRRADHWRTWLAEHPTAKANHADTAAMLEQLYNEMIPEAEAAFGRLQAIPSPAEVRCVAPGCERTFRARANRRTCSAACRQSLRRVDARERRLKAPRSAAKHLPVLPEQMPESVTSQGAPSHERNRG